MAYTAALSHIRNVPVTDSSNETLRPFILAYQGYRRAASSGNEQDELSCYMEAVTSYSAARATLDALETTAQPVPTPKTPAHAPTPAVAVVEGTVQWIDIDLIDPHPMNPRIAHPSQVFDALTAQMERDGRASPNHPLIVREVNARYQTLSGNTRLGAGTKARLRQMPVIVIEATDAEALVYLAAANVQEPLSPLEQGLHSIEVEKLGVTVKDYAIQCGLQPSNLSRYRKGARVFLAVRGELGDENVIALRDRAEHLAAIEKSPQDQWGRLARLCVDEKWSLIETKRHVEAIVVGTQEPSGVVIEETEPLDPVIAHDTAAEDVEPVADDTTNGAMRDNPKLGPPRAAPAHRPAWRTRRAKRTGL
jgi:ParB-like chromosome segregation protein Spo0J